MDKGVKQVGTLRLLTSEVGRIAARRIDAREPKSGKPVHLDKLMRLIREQTPKSLKPHLLIIEQLLLCYPFGDVLPVLEAIESVAPVMIDEMQGIHARVQHLRKASGISEVFDIEKLIGIERALRAAANMPE
jgi:hypothetical protein